MSNLIVKRDSFEVQDLNMKRKDVVFAPENKPWMSTRIISARIITTQMRYDKIAEHYRLEEVVRTNIVDKNIYEAIEYGVKLNRLSMIFSILEHHESFVLLFQDKYDLELKACLFEEWLKGDDRYGDYFYYKGRTLTQMLEEYVNEF